MAAVGFFIHYLNGPFPYVQYHINVNKNVLSALLNKTFPSFLYFQINMEIYQLQHIKYWLMGRKRQLVHETSKSERKMPIEDLDLDTKNMYVMPESQ